jgi:endonuclease-8
MPEGDNIHAHALELNEALTGTPLTAVWSRGVQMRGLLGHAVTEARAVGKHLLISFDEGTAVRVHLGIAGRWLRLKRASTATLARAELALVTADLAYVCRARTIEWARAALVANSRALAALGPDLLAPAPDLEAVLARARRPEHAARPMGELLLAQSVASGLGNVYKCELLFLHGVDPWTRVDAVSDETLRAIFADGVRFLRANVGQPRTLTAELGRGARPARGRGRYWVYGRARRPCYRCGTVIAQRRMGPGLRPTFWCPRCQPPVNTSGAPAS